LKIIYGEHVDNSAKALLRGLWTTRLERDDGSFRFV
jgi:hypothetical protein